MLLLKAILLGSALCVTVEMTWCAQTRPVTPSVAQAFDKASRLLKDGRAADARKVYESLLPALRRDAPSAQLGFVLNAMGKIVAGDGSYDEAIAFAQQSADIYQRLGDAGGQSHALNNKAIAEVEKGEYPAARSDLSEALRLARLSNDDENQTQILNNLGSAYYFPGSYSEALQSYDLAIDLIDHNPSASWNDYWRQITSVNRATLFQRLGHNEQALQIYRQVESSSKTLSPGDRAHLYANVGALYRRLGDPYKALETYRTAQSLYSKEHDADGELAVLKNIGIAYALDLQDLRGALSIFTRALALAKSTQNRREEMQAHLYLGETLLRANSPARSLSEFEQAQNFADQLGTSEEKWKSLYGLGRVEERSGNLGVAESDYRQSIAIIEKSRSQLQLTALKTDFFADKREVYDSLIALLLKDQNIPEAFEMLERSRARSFRDRLELRNPQFDAAALTLTQAQAALDPATVLLEYWAAPHQIGLIWCTKQKYGMVLRETGPADEAAIHSLLGNLPESLVHASQEQATLLNNLFPAESALPPDIRHILIVPDGWISFLPLDLLHLRGATQPLLIEQYDISYLPTAALLRRVHEPERRLRFPWTRELVAFGDPSTKSSNSAPSFGDSDLTDSQPLPYSETEIRAIGELLPGASQLFLKQNDLKKFFLDGRANQAFLLHVSTHAFADIDNPENSRLLFSPSSDGGSADYVFLRQLYDLDLSNVHLATISACDSERGKLNRGEGVQAFSRALLSAGARSALTALWRVDDQPTAEFMRQFYFFALRRHTSKAEALRLAKLKFLHSNTRLSDPLIWATFILSGDGQTPLPAVISWTTLALATALFAGVSFVFASILLRHRRRIHGKHKA